MDKKIYNKWYAMINRCKTDYQFYSNVTICEEWMEFKSFEKWYLENIYDFNGILELDKDLFSDSKKIYSPDTCCLLPKEINLLINAANSKNDLLPGVTRNIGKKSITYTATIIHGRKELKQTFKTQLDAFQFYKTQKEKVIKEVAEKYRDVLPYWIYSKLIRFEIPMTCEILENAIKNKEKMRPEAYEEIINSFKV